MAQGDTTKINQERKLTAKDVTALEKELPGVDSEMARIRSEKQAANAKFSQEMKPLKKRQEEILKALETGTETTEVEVVEDWDLAGNVIIFRDSRGKEVARRDMAPAEETSARQTTIGDVDGGRHVRGKRKVPRQKTEA